MDEENENQFHVSSKPMYLSKQPAEEETKRRKQVALNLCNFTRCVRSKCNILDVQVHFKCIRETWVDDLTKIHWINDSTGERQRRSESFCCDGGSRERERERERNELPGVVGLVDEHLGGDCKRDSGAESKALVFALSSPEWRWSGDGVMCRFWWE